MALTNIQCKQAIPKEKPYKLTESGDLYLLVNPNGRKNGLHPRSYCYGRILISMAASFLEMPNRFCCMVYCFVSVVIGAICSWRIYIIQDIP